MYFCLFEEKKKEITANGSVYYALYLCIVSVCTHIFVSIPSQELDFQRHMLWYFFFTFNDLRREVNVWFVFILVELLTVTVSTFFS